MSDYEDDSENRMMASDEDDSDYEMTDDDSDDSYNRSPGRIVLSVSQMSDILSDIFGRRFRGETSEELDLERHRILAENKMKLSELQKRQKEEFMSSDIVKSIKEEIGLENMHMWPHLKAGSQRRKRLSRLEREWHQRGLTSKLVPNKKTSTIIEDSNEIFCSQYTKDGQYYLVASRDCLIKLYHDVAIEEIGQMNMEINAYLDEHTEKLLLPQIKTNTRSSIHELRLRELRSERLESLIDIDKYTDHLRESIAKEYFKNKKYPYRIDHSTQGTVALPVQQFLAREIRYSCIDVDMAKDGSAIIYSSWSPYIQYISTKPDLAIEDEQYESYHDFSDMKNVEHYGCQLATNMDSAFCAFSIQFSSENRQILAGGSDGRCYIYDIHSQTCPYHFEAHHQDVNSVEYFMDHSNVFISGSDDRLIKIWDTRYLNNTNPKPVGIFKGHGQGITKISTKGDGKYFLSNSKDQSIKIWDARMLAQIDVDETNSYENQAMDRYNMWDYRNSSTPPPPSADAIASDRSVLTLQGHSVHRTLIRAYFSPQSTGQRYIYSGDAKGSVFIYDLLDGSCIREMNGHNDCVRDLSWHPFKPYLLSSSWDGTVSMWHHHTDPTNVV